MAVQPWSGVRSVAFIPVSNSQVDTNVPADFQKQVFERAFIDPDPATNVDRSLKSYLHTISSGRASLRGYVFPPVVAPDADVITPALESLPSIKFPFGVQIPVHGFDLAVVVLPHSAGQHRGGFAWFPGTKVNGISFYCRVALQTMPNLSNRQNIGVWAMEALHMICRFGDLYFSNPPVDRFDVMSCACGTHPTSHTKTQLGWADASSTASHGLGTVEEYSLIAVSYPQPPPPGRQLAVRIPSQIDSSHFVVEAREHSDVYESQSAVSQGIAAEGVLVYQVRDTADLELRSSGLTVGESFTSPQEDLTVSVERALAGGYTVKITSRATALCRRLQEQADSIKLSLELETDIVARKQLISALAKVLKEMRVLGCTNINSISHLDEEVKGRFLGQRLDAIMGGENSQEGHDSPETGAGEHASDQEHP